MGCMPTFSSVSQVGLSYHDKVYHWPFRSPDQKGDEWLHRLL
jgi:hypothetical protein